VRLLQRPEKRRHFYWLGYLTGLGLVAFIVLLKTLGQPTFIPVNLSYPFMLAIVPVAIYFGLGPALATSILSTLAHHFFFYTPLRSFALPTIEELWTLVTFFLVSLIISLLASYLRHETEVARRLHKDLVEVQEIERKSIARELHDDTAPNLAYLSLKIDAIVSKSTNLTEKDITQLKEIRQGINKAQQNIRHYSHELHPAVLDNLGFEPALETLITEFNSITGMQIKFEVSGMERILQDDVKLALYRITQEALNNILKHAKTSTAVVILRYSRNRTRLSITDNGVGFDSSLKSKGIGLSSMQERANLIGAKLEIESRANQGTTVSVEV